MFRNMKISFYIIKQSYFDKHNNIYKLENCLTTWCCKDTVEMMDKMAYKYFSHADNVIRIIDGKEEYLDNMEYIEAVEFKKPLIVKKPPKDKWEYMVMMFLKMLEPDTRIITISQRL